MTPVEPATQPQDSPGSPERPEVVSVTDAAGIHWYAWRKDGAAMVIDLAAFANNRHSALKGDPGADYVDRFGPEGAPRG